MVWRKKRIARYQTFSPWLPQIVFSLFICRRQFRNLSFYSPTSWTDWHWQFVVAAALIGSLLVALAVGIWKSIEHRESVFEVSANRLLSIQRCDKGKDSEKPKSILLSNVQDIESADENWINFVLTKQPQTEDSEENDLFNLHVGMLWPTERYHVCRILVESGLADVTKETKSWHLRMPQFSIMNILAFTTFMAIIAMVNRWVMVDWGTTRTAAAMATALATFAAGMLTVFGGAIWVAASDSSGAHRCVAIGGLLMLASFPAGLLLPFLYNTPEVIQGIQTVLSRHHPIVIVLFSFLPFFMLKTAYDRFG